jgi:hypothetical protein
MDHTRRLERVLRYFAMGHRRLESRRRRHELQMLLLRAQEREVAQRLQDLETGAVGQMSAAAWRWRAHAISRMETTSRRLADQGRQLRAEMSASRRELAGSEARMNGLRRVLAEAVRGDQQRLARTEQAELDQRAAIASSGEHRRK